MNSQIAKFLLSEKVRENAAVLHSFISREKKNAKLYKKLGINYLELKSILKS